MLIQFFEASKYAAFFHSPSHCSLRDIDVTSLTSLMKKTNTEDESKSKLEANSPKSKFILSAIRTLSIHAKPKQTSLQSSSESSTELFHPLLTVTTMIQAGLSQNSQVTPISPWAEGLQLGSHAHGGHCTSHLKQHRSGNGKLS